MINENSLDIIESTQVHLGNIEVMNLEGNYHINIDSKIGNDGFKILNKNFKFLTGLTDLNISSIIYEKIRQFN